MEMLLAFVVGFAVGGQGGPRDRHNVAQSFGTIRNSEEVAAVVLLVRSQVGRSMREVADMVDGNGPEGPSPPDLVDRVRALVQP
jgi:hypothetical protein